MYKRQQQPKATDIDEVEEEAATGCATGCCSVMLFVLSCILVVFTLPFSLFFIIKVVPQYERAVIFRLGRIKDGKEKGPGLFFILPCIDKFTSVDIRIKSFDVPPQKILTKDSVTVHVDAVVNFHIFNAVMSVKNITDATRATQLLAQTTLRNILGTHRLSELLSARETLQEQLRRMLDEGTDPWGVKVDLVSIKDVRIPKEMQRAMAAEAEADREAKAKIIASEGELNSARALKEAAETIQKSPTALQLRYLQTLNTIAAERGSTILFPIPMDVMGTGNIRVQE